MLHDGRNVFAYVRRSAKVPKNFGTDFEEFFVGWEVGRWYDWLVVRFLW